MTDLQIPAEPTTHARKATAPRTPSAAPVASRPTAAPGVLTRLVGVAGAIGLVMSAMVLMGGHPIVLLQLTAALIVLAMAGFGLVASDGPYLVLRLCAVVCGSKVRDAAEAERLRAACRRGRRLSYSGGVLALLLGTMHMLSVLDQPSMIGPAIAVSLVGLVHAALLAELGFGAAEHWVRAGQA